MSNNQLWKAKLAAWIHDPAEKSLTLLRDKTGHEFGTAKKLRNALNIDYGDLLKEADWYASAADRPQFPRKEKDGSYASWTQVNFAEKPVLKHPLTGTELNLGKLSDIHPEHVKALSTDHFKQLMVESADGEGYDWEKTLLNFWRFAPDLNSTELGKLWRLLPADTRVPDHTIWEHLDIVSAFAGAMNQDKNSTPALLSVSFGPIQGFIAEARSTSDLWAGSHLLARIAWEGMRVVCEQLGPDAVLFPNLRGVPLVDVWLRDKGLPDQLFADEEWAKTKTDVNPLFAAALPNRFVALVPADKAKLIAEQIESEVKEFVNQQGTRALKKILKAIGEDSQSDLHCYKQLDEQLKGFPEVYWAAVPWSLAGNDKKADDRELRSILSNFLEDSEHDGFLNSDAWKVLQNEIALDGAKFYQPNPGVLYPALYDLLDRVAAASKSARPFSQLKQYGYRSSLNGEREWLTLNEEQLSLPPGQRGDTLWSKLAEVKPSWAKKGEHLDALNTIKRLWPTLFLEEVGEIVGSSVQRYVISTHTLALSVSLDEWLRSPNKRGLPIRLKAVLGALKEQGENAVALPKCMMPMVSNDKDAELLCKWLPAALDQFRDLQVYGAKDEQAQSDEALHNLESDIAQLFGAKPEAYYGLILLDGDKMGAWVSGDEKYQISYGDCWHPAIRSGVENKFADNPSVQKYFNQKRATSPARHRSISEALNQFSIKVARFVVEDCFKGKLIYSGGDDVLAFVCVDDLLPAMTALRYFYSGRPLPEWVMQRLRKTRKEWFDESGNCWKFKSENGYLLLNLKGKSELLLTMGEKAEASCGAIVAHHQAPLGTVLNHLRAAESEAKNAGGRNAFSLQVFKRAGGKISVTDKWEREQSEKSQSPELLDRLIHMLSRSDVSRRAAYHSLTWLKQLPHDASPDLLKASLAFQFEQQGSQSDRQLADELIDYVTSTNTRREPDGSLASMIENILMVSEFLARETRHAVDKEVV